MAPHIEIPTSIREEAAEWWDELYDEEPSATDNREFAAWVSRSPERVEAYLDVVRLQRALGSPRIRWPTAAPEQLIQEAKDAPEESWPPLRSTGATPPPRLRTLPSLRPQWALGLVLMLLVAFGSTWLLLTAPEQYSTRLGEQRSIALKDGSRITLNTASRVEVDFNRSHRGVRLVQGEALFNVTGDAGRPFEVTAGNSVLRVLGTRFNVDMRPRRTTVTVIEGRVAKALHGGTDQGPVLVAGDRLIVDDSGADTIQHGVDVGAVLSWIQRQLVFERRTLGEVADEFNRYNRDRIVIRGDALRREEVSGVFQSNDISSFVGFLANIPGVSIATDRSGAYIVTQQRLEQSTEPPPASRF
jgi:transmembrane sensor